MKGGPCKQYVSGGVSDTWVFMLLIDLVQGKGQVTNKDIFGVPDTWTLCCVANPLPLAHCERWVTDKIRFCRSL